jgi:hypothetical protein
MLEGIRPLMPLSLECQYSRGYATADDYTRQTCRAIFEKIERIDKIEFHGDIITPV